MTSFQSMAASVGSVFRASGLGGQAVLDQNTEKVANMKPVKDRVIKVQFNADVSSSMQWNFRPQQHEVNVVPGETALIFYTARNPTDKPIVGISTYNILPFEAGKYFNKIQVDMPVFFYIDPDFAEDPYLMCTETIVLSYTFFEAKDGMKLPLPGYSSQRS